MAENVHDERAMRDLGASPEPAGEEPKAVGAAPPEAPPVGVLRGDRVGRDGALEVTVEGRVLRLTNLDKVLYPEPGFTKGQVIDYYARIAPTVLPHVRGRPITLKRYPDGVGAKHFYEKQVPPWAPDWVPTARVWSDQKGDHIAFLLICDLTSLLWSANTANIELHPFLATTEDLGRPTSVAFDLDPGEPAGLLEAARIAAVLRDMLAGLGLRSFVKTSGCKAMHVVLPLNT